MLFRFETPTVNFQIIFMLKDAQKIRCFIKYEDVYKIYKQFFTFKKHKKFFFNSKNFHYRLEGL